MTNSWDKYFAYYSDWDDAHCFNVRLELKFEEEIKKIGLKLDEYVCLINCPMSDKQYNKVYTVNFLGNVIEGNPIKYLNVEISDMKKAAIKMGTTPIKDKITFLNNIKNIKNIPIITKPRVKI